MKVRVYSDLHLEFDNEGEEFDPGTGDVLVLAGDICLVADYDRYHNFFMKCVEGYEKVYYVMGNHEHYYSDFQTTYHKLQEKLPKGITLLNNKSECYGGVHFVGATLWTNMNNLNADTIMSAGETMNDYHIITKDGGSFMPHDSIDEHMFTRDWFDQLFDNLRGDVFVITHHSPSMKSVKGRYVSSAGTYANNMEKMITDNPNIKYWAHGHIHHCNDYEVGQCRVISNPRGYNHSELNDDFNPNFEIEIGE